MKKTWYILSYDNKIKSLNLILIFVLDNPFVSKVCVTSGLEKKIPYRYARIISLFFFMPTF